MSSDIEARVVEAMTIAMLNADFAPHIASLYADQSFRHTEDWRKREAKALRQYRAFLAMQSILIGQEAQDRVTAQKAGEGAM